ncbi:MAG: hypothetical protein DMF82_04860 [Acidobacteria bacterium]|nr:MAG: hypothetical protein DMF82_04860 [Acidobacteriota bacterium]
MSGLGRGLALAVLAVAAAGTAHAQPISLEEGVRAAGLWCFPLASDASQYVYLPDTVRLAKDDAGRPQFSFVRYVVNAPGTGSASVTSAGGGGIVHFLVVMETPPQAVRAAEQALQRERPGAKAVLRGPLVFREGRYTLVSSILAPGGSGPERTVMAMGRAPALEGNRLAFSFDLDPQHATLLMQSLAMNTPDVSLVFDMTFDGLTAAYDAELTVDWAEVRKSEAFKAGASVYFVGADVERTLDELRRTNAVRLRSSGSSQATQGLVDAAYGKLMELLFRPVEPERVPESQRGGLLDALAALFDPEKMSQARRNLSGFGAHVGYQLKELKTEGTSVLRFNNRSSVERHSLTAFNLGDFYRQHGGDPNYFRAVNLGEATFQQREVRVNVDGGLAADFERYVNTVTVTLRKQHQNGESTVQEVVLDRQHLGQAADLRMVYGWNGDDDRLAWLEYHYRTRWSFQGGGSYETDWARADGPMIDLFAPYQRQTVRVVGSAAALKEKKVRSVAVELEYPFFGTSRRQQVVLRPEDPAEPPPVQITLPLNQFEYGYVITWQLEGGRRLVSKGRDTSGIVFVDELPPSEGD